MNPTVYLIDDSISIRRGLTRMLKTRGYRVQAYEAAEEFLEALPEDPVGCVLLDLDMPRMGGIEAQRQLAELAARLPVVFVTGRGSISTCTQALKAGAVDFLEKPVDEERLCASIEQAISHNATARSEHALREEARALVARLTAREHEVLSLVTRGFNSQEIADLLGIAKGTVKIHRKRMMAKLEVTGIAEVITVCQQAALD